MSVLISNCGKDERGKYSGGLAGDQTKEEWRVRTWYNGKWTAVFRHPDAQVRFMLARLARAAANNNCIGYDQGQRLTFWQQLQKAGYDPAKITTNCEADCSSGVAAIVKATGYLLGNSRLQNVSPSVYTGNQSAALCAAGFEKLTEGKYRLTSSNLTDGDILLSNGHTVIVVDGACEGTQSDSLAVDGIWGSNTTKALQRTLGTTVDGIVSDQYAGYRASNPGLESSSWEWRNKTKSGSDVIRALQKKIGVNPDGLFGPVTCKAFQIYLGTTPDGAVSNPSDMVKEMQRRLNAETLFK